ncbi:hypothetical protein ACFCVY_04795 [Streptomyces sp. NPDC056411]|uniref:hypothetical protein n=1 Tax=Streptomyces sp. NPDC056411 TaxID=3345813 RepID=UPI0035DE0810
MPHPCPVRPYARTPVRLADSAPAGRLRAPGPPAVHARMRQLGGTLTMESTPGEGTVLSAAISLEHVP